MKMVSRTRNVVIFLLICSFFSTIPADGYLTVRTDPEGIEVWLDDNFVGDSPIIDKKLKAGRYSLKLVDPVQHSSTVEEVFIQDDENTVIEKTIKSKFGSLKVNSVPEGAIVSIATELGPTPVSNDFMNPGKYRVEIKHPNKLYHSAVEEVVIPRGESVTLSKTLEQEERFSKKDFWRIALGVGTAGFYTWGLIQHGVFKEYKENKRMNELPPYSGTELLPENESTRKSALVQSILGIVGGSLCLIGLEIVAFF